MQAKPKAAPRGGVSSSMIILESEPLDRGIVLNSAEARDNDEYYAMVDSGTNAIILPLHPRMEGEIAECQVPSATVTGPIVQVYEFNGSQRFVGCVTPINHPCFTRMADFYSRMGVHFRTKSRIRK